MSRKNDAMPNARKQVGTKLTDKDAEALDKEARCRGLSRYELIRRLILEFTEDPRGMV